MKKLLTFFLITLFSSTSLGYESYCDTLTANEKKRFDFCLAQEKDSGASLRIQVSKPSNNNSINNLLNSFGVSLSGTSSISYDVKDSYAGSSNDYYRDALMNGNKAYRNGDLQRALFLWEVCANQYNPSQYQATCRKNMSNAIKAADAKKAAARKAEANRKAAARKAESDRKAAARKAEANRKAAARKAEANRKAELERIAVTEKTEKIIAVELEKLKDNFFLDIQDSDLFILTHTLSHLLIRQLTFNSGYSSSALRERIFVDPGIDYAGIMIYTSELDAEGTMGGLVDQARFEAIDLVLEKITESAIWCSADPVCRETQSQGFSGLNRSACHCCSLIAETSCTFQNAMLNRLTLGGLGKERDEVSGIFNYIQDLIQ